MNNTIYCGNNLLDPDVVSGRSVLGNRYQCLRKGIGTGLNLPFDEKYRGPYQPVDDRKIYCGLNNNLPLNYFAFGSNHNCLQKGVAIGKSIKANNGSTSFFYKYLLLILIFIYIIFAIGLFLLLFYLKPKSFIYIDKNNKELIDWYKFLTFYTIILLCISIIFYIFYSHWR
jgi:hypothetical protein